MADARVRKIRLVLLAILVANWAVALAKLVFGLASGSTALTADGVHSFIDGASNVVGLVAISVASQPADKNHPYGHGKFESLASLAIGAMIGVTMLELGRMAFAALKDGTSPEVGDGTIAATVLTMLVNIVVTRVERSLGQKLNSPLLTADAQHTLSDVFVSVSVLGSLVMSRLGIARVDGLMTLVVLFFVARTAYSIIRDAAASLADEVRLDPAEVASVSVAVDGVHRVRRVRSRGMEHHVYVDLAIEVKPSLQVGAAHDLAHRVEQALKTHFPQVVDVVVHVEPASR